MDKTVAPRPSNMTSIPSTLSSLQNEWDAIILEHYTLKQQHEQMRQDLAQALYQQDAAIRVIARLMKEREQLRAELANTQKNMSIAVSQASSLPSVSVSVAPSAPSVSASTTAATTQQADVTMAEADEKGIGSELQKKMQTNAKTLSKGRKKAVKALQTKATSVEKIKSFEEIESHPLHSSTKPGITCVDLHPTDSEVVLTGGMDANAIVFNHKTGKILDTLKAHKKKITSVRFHPLFSETKMIVSTSADESTIVWQQKENKFAPVYTFTDQKAEVVGASFHPLSSYFVTASKDKTWAFYDLEKGVCRQLVADEKVTAPFTKISVHPDGLILACGTADSLVRIYDVRERKNVATCKGHLGDVTGLSFSENGCFLASGDEQGTIKLWDLRRLENFQTLSPEQTGAAAGIQCLQFDPSGSYLASSSTDVRIYNALTDWSIIKTYKAHSSEVTCVQFGADASYFCSASLDRSLKFYGPASASASATA
eukprot:TRINITY_DN7647_c0_g1_i1.p1 TRINITY_DN7647_c0_g1~~TRINITY_DN7647_c0_g1_i1.p1  ORF type:complete len:547 (+),score=158.35 TRINITY_DN7647_c0_g1_i1:191-1642(+)